MNNPLNDIVSSDRELAYQKQMAERRKNIKKGDNIIHLNYLGGVLTDNDIQEIKDILSQSQLELSYFDCNGLIQNCLEDYLNIVFIGINSTLISNILTGVLSSAVWDSIKLSIKKVWLKVRNEKYIQITAYSQEKKQISFGLEINLDKNTNFKFKLDGELTEELIETTLDQALKILKEQKVNEYPKKTYFMTYNLTSKSWDKLDVEEEIRKKMDE